MLVCLHDLVVSQSKLNPCSAPEDFFWAAQLPLMPTFRAQVVAFSHESHAVPAWRGVVGLPVITDTTHTLSRGVAAANNARPCLGSCTCLAPLLLHRVAFPCHNTEPNIAIQLGR